MENMIVDISFNQLGGLCTLSFLEQVWAIQFVIKIAMIGHLIVAQKWVGWFQSGLVTIILCLLILVWKVQWCSDFSSFYILLGLQVDQYIGKDHIFKRSIILIKAWCYYESRILGAHHGLISTYALETLVLYIFHLFHSSLDGPLTVSTW